jgi:hypothetical protein
MCCCLCFAGRSCKRIEFGLCRRDLPAVDRKAEGRDIGAHAATFAEQNGRQPNTLINRRPSRISSVESNPRLLILILLVGGPARGDITGPLFAGCRTSGRGRMKEWPKRLRFAATKCRGDVWSVFWSLPPITRPRSTWKLRVHALGASLSRPRC